MTTAVTTPSRMNVNERRVIRVASWAHCVDHMPELTFAALIALFQSEYNTSLTALGGIASASALAFGLTAPLGGFLADRIGSKRILMVFAVSASAAALLVAASTSLLMLGVTFTLLGLAAGLYHPVGLSFISKVVRARSMAMGYHGMAGNLGAGLAPALAVFLASIFSWRAAFVVLALLFLSLAIGIFMSKAEEPSYGRAPRTPATSSDSHPDARGYLAPLLAVFAVNMLAGLIFRGAMTFLPKHFAQYLGISVFHLDPVALGGYVSTLALIFSIPGQYLGGWLGERVRREYALVPVAALIVPGLVLLGIGAGPLLLMGGAFFAFFNFMAQPIYTALVADYSPTRLRGSIFGLSFLSAFGLSFYAPAVAGYIADTWGTHWVFRILTGVEVLVGILAVYLLLAAGTHTRRASGQATGPMRKG